MGVTRDSLNFLNRNLPDFVTSICELGDQQFKLCEPFPFDMHTKKFWEQQVDRYVSIDQNGQGESLVMDLDQPLDIKKLGQFDVVTDFGTAEHTQNIYMCLKNVHDLTKTGGLMVHVLPAPNNWPDHGNWYLGEEFFQKLALANNYKMLELYDEKCSFGGNDSHQTHCAMIKRVDSEFMAEDDFYSELPIYKE